MNVHSRRQVFATTVLLAVVLVCQSQISSTAAIAASNAACSSPTCWYLPLTVTAPPVRIYSQQLVPHRGGFVRAFGEVINISSSPVYSVTLVADFFGGNPSPHTITGTTSLSAIFPDQRIPYDLYDPVNTRNVSAINVRIVSWATTSTLTYQPLTVVSKVSEPFDQIVATLRNDSPFEVKEMRGVGWAGNQSSVIFVRDVASSVQPGATVTFTTIIQPTSDPEDVHIAAQGVVSP